MLNQEKKEVNKEEELYHYRGEYEVKLSSDLYLQLSKEKKPVGMKTGISSLDRLVGGIVPGELVVLSGWTGGGKTTFARTLTKNFFQQDVMSCWFQFEETYYQFFEKFKADYIQALPVFSLPVKTKPQSLKWFEDRVRESILKYGVKVVFIDHLHRLLDYQVDYSILKGVGGNSVFVGANVMAIKAMAIKYDISIILIAHTSKAKPNDPNEKLGLGSVRDSSFIEQEADTVLYIWRSVDEDNLANLKIAKDRKNGTSGVIINLKHNPATKDFSERSDNYGA